MSVRTEVSPREKKRQRSAMVQVLLIVAFLALVWFSFGRNVLAPLDRSGAPDRLDSLRLVSSVAGEEALAQVGRLHGADLGLVDAYIASYSGGNGNATVWVGRAASSDMAAQLLDMMVKGIADGNESFGNMRRLDVAQGYHSHEVFQVEGAGGKHFFFISKGSPDSVVWVSVETEDAMPILQQSINAF
ncbi:MAG: hypothetical protein HYX91_01780 [Chloroflexi bacterium]|nr:hypothetical protein [Chloroflexota bacterium]